MSERDEWKKRNFGNVQSIPRGLSQILALSVSRCDAAKLKESWARENTELVAAFEIMRKDVR